MRMERVKRGIKFSTNFKINQLKKKPLNHQKQPRTNNTNIIHSKLEKEKISLITSHLLNFNIWLEGLSDAGWNIRREGGFAFDPLGEYV